MDLTRNKLHHAFKQTLHLADSFERRYFRSTSFYDAVQAGEFIAAVNSIPEVDQAKIALRKADRMFVFIEQTSEQCQAGDQLVFKDGTCISEGW